MTFIFFPNSQGPPHIGHVYNVLINRLMFLYWKQYAKNARVDKVVNLRWELWWDHKAKTEYFDLYRSMLEWMGCSAERELSMDTYANDINGIAAPDDMRNEVLDMLPAAEKAGCFHMMNVKRIARSNSSCMHIADSQESCIARVLRLHYPQTVWHSEICNDKDERISSSAHDPDYTLDTNIPFDRFIGWFMSFCVDNVTQFDSLLADSVDDNTFQMARNLCAMTEKTIRPNPLKQTVIPRNWKELA